MKLLSKNIIVVIALSFLFNGCFSSSDLEYNYNDDCEETVIIIETPPPIYIEPSPPIIIRPEYPVVEEPKKKRRNSGEKRRGTLPRTGRTSYLARDTHRNSIVRNNLDRNERHSVEKRTRKRR